MHSIVVVRETWDTRDLAPGALDASGNPRADQMGTHFEPEDLNALEMALQVKDRMGGKVTAVSLRQPRGLDVLRECLYRGVDAVIRVTYPEAETLDTEAQAGLLAAAVRKIPDAAVVFTGFTQVEGENSLLGPHLAAALGFEQLTGVDSLEEAAPDRVVGRRAIEMGYESVEVRLPAVLSVGVALLKEDPRSPRPAKATLKLKFKKTEVPVWSAESLAIADVAALRTTCAAGREVVPERVIVSKQVDIQDTPALKAMLAELLAV